jgi:hypothetical protein
MTHEKTSGAMRHLMLKAINLKPKIGSLGSDQDKGVRRNKYLPAVSSIT